jgi:hypothetical protein
MMMFLCRGVSCTNLQELLKAEDHLTGLLQSNVLPADEDEQPITESPDWRIMTSMMTGGGDETPTKKKNPCPSRASDQ